jgi:deazaflavin-dependent oxidoreductase (nitroreductase family)
MEIIERPPPPTGLRRLLFRLPIHLYRAGLGWLFGRRCLLLTHVGRRSGKPRQVVIEVVEHDRADESYFVCSGFGPRADWYRNLLATPSATIMIGRRRIPVEAVALPSNEGSELMARYAERHPAAARKLARFMGFGLDGSAEDYRAAGRELPFVRLRPRH